MDSQEKVMFWDSFSDNPYIGITVINKEGIIIFRSKFGERLTGIKSSDLVGKHYSNLAHYEEIKQVFENGEYKTSRPLKTINGCYTIVDRIPLKKGDEIIGALSISTINDIRDIKILLDKYDFVKNKLKYYDSELRKLRAARYTFSSIIGENNKVLLNKKLAKNYAHGDAPVLITGETGTGKELYANAIHIESSRRDRPFIRVNCGAIPPDLLESELFGHEEGAFTGAKKGNKIGKFELANHGTIFLDEISSLNLSMQPKLLTALQNREIERIGSNKIIKLDFRVISATNELLEEKMQEGLFRSDLYYRLSVLNLKLFPLRERKDDIELLCNYFLESFNEEYGFKITEIDPAILEIFHGWDWPGNIRELRNALERAVQVSNKVCVTVDDLPDYLVDNRQVHGLKKPGKMSVNVMKATKDSVEKKLLISALSASNWNKSNAAKKLGVSRSHLYAIMKKYNMKVEGDKLVPIHK